MRSKLVPISIALSVLLLTPSVAEQSAATSLSTQAIGLVQTQLDSEISKAETPEEAARIFMKLVSIGVSKAVADALPKSLSTVAVSTASTGNTKIAGWQNYALAGLNLEWNWATPGLLATSQYIAAVQSSAAAPAAAGDVHTKGVDITIGVGIHF